MGIELLCCIFMVAMAALCVWVIASDIGRNKEKIKLIEWAQKQSPEVRRAILDYFGISGKFLID